MQVYRIFDSSIKRYDKRRIQRILIKHLELINKKIMKTQSQITTATEFDKKGFIVLESNHQEGKIVIAIEKWFEEKSDDEEVYYDNYGQKCYVGGEEGIGPFLGYDYHDGHNWRTVTISADFFDADYSRVDEEKEREILEAFFIKSYKSEGQGLKHYEANDFIFTVSAWQGSWEIATVESGL